ncbi:SprB repeat-containing protein, partial [Capnocytophaga sputigena]|uniref:SprB repeat-containing protein n=1 Tax=Capnocytophaga sputigena TaxID=1019 RepID=UPI0031F5647D
MTDSKGCMVSGSATLLNAVAPIVTVSTTTVGCYGANNGTISLTISGGKAPYKVFLDGVAKGSQLVFNNLAAKTYAIKVVDVNNCETIKNATITQPGAPLKGFAAVSQLIGCGTGTNKDKAEVRITNVSGGTAPYQYKFSGNYSNLNSGWLSAGTHTVYVKDANGCELGMTVTVTAKIPEPMGTTYTITGYDCNGNATVRFMGLPTSYNYTYEIGGKTATGTTATITGLAPGNYTVTIKYKNANPPAASILIQDDFGIGEDTCSANVAPAIQCGPGMVPTPGRYVIGSNSSLFVQSHLTYWSNANDHTNPANNKSRMLMIDIGNVGNGDVLYQKTVNIDPNRKIKYKMFVMNLEKVGMSGALPDIKIRLINPVTNTQIGSEQDYGTIARSSNPNDWHEFSGELNPGNINQVRIEIRTKSWAGVGCDMALDDIFVYQEPNSCEQEITKQVVVPSGKEFKASVVSITHATCKG